MAIANVTFTQYYSYEVEVDDALYEDDPWAAEEQAIDEAREQFEATMRQPIARIYYDDVEVEIQ